MIQIPP
jgi:hypothetical protein